MPLWSILGAPGCGPGPLPEPDELLATFRALHARVYQVYELEHDRDAVHELLSGSFAGEALTQEYVEHWTARARLAEAQTRVQILRVDHDALSVLRLEPEHALIDASWSVGGVVSHRGHQHQRLNRYRALYALDRIEPGGDPDPGWRIVDTHLRDVERIDRPDRGTDLFDELLDQDRGGFLDPLDLFDRIEAP